MPLLQEPFVLRDREQLARLKNEQNKSFRTLARDAQVSKSVLEELASGKQATCRYSTAERIAQALQVNVTDLFRPQYVEGE